MVLHVDTYCVYLMKYANSLIPYIFCLSNVLGVFLWIIAYILQGRFSCTGVTTWFLMITPVQWKNFGGFLGALAKK